MNLPLTRLWGRRNGIKDYSASSALYRKSAVQVHEGDGVSPSLHY